jgi:integrase/recombinase XerD
MVTVVRKSALPMPAEVPERLRDAALAAASISLREPRLQGFPVFFTDSMEIIEPVVAFLHEHAIQRAHTNDTVRTYAEILFDWIDTLEQSSIAWDEADGADLVACRNRMLTQASQRTGRPYAVRTINHRVRGVLRFYDWSVRAGWIKASPLAGRPTDFAVSHRERWRSGRSPERSVFVLRQFESLPQPLNPAQARELLAELAPPYDLMARWLIYTGLRVSELLRLTVHDILKHKTARRSPVAGTHHTIRLIRKGRKQGYVIASETLFTETDAYIELHRAARPHRSFRRSSGEGELFVGPRGGPVRKNTYQQVVRLAAERCGFAATTHQLRATFACMMLARLEQLAKSGEPINPLLVVKVLMGHEHIWFALQFDPRPLAGAPENGAIATYAPRGLRLAKYSTEILAQASNYDEPTAPGEHKGRRRAINSHI